MMNLFCSLQKDIQQRERKGCLRPMEGSAAILEHLKMIEVRCDAVDERICRLTLFLCAFHIRKLTCYTPRASTFLSLAVTFICVKTSLRRLHMVAGQGQATSLAVSSHIPQPCAKSAIARCRPDRAQNMCCGEPAKPPFLNGVLHKFCQK